MYFALKQSLVAFLLVLLRMSSPTSAEVPGAPIPLQDEAPSAVNSNPNAPLEVDFRDQIDVPFDTEADSEGIDIQLDPTLIEPEWKPEFDSENGLRLWDCIVLALENNRPLRNSREDLRSALVTLRERREEFGSIYSLGAGAHYDNNGAPAPVARSDAGVDRDRFSFSFGGLDDSGTFLSRQFPGGGTLSLGAQSVYNSQTATRLREFVDPNGNLFFVPHLRDVRWFSEANIAITQPLLEGAGGVASTSLRIQELEKAARGLGLEQQIQNVISQAVRGYLQVQLQISLAEIQQQAYDRAIDLFRRTMEEDVLYKTRKPRRAVIQGPIPPGERSKGVGPLDKVRSEQQITASKQRLIDAKNNVETSLIDLRLTLGLEPNTAIVLAGTEVPEVGPPELTLEEAIQLGLERRPDYRVAQIAKNQAVLNLRAAENAMLPNLDLSWRMAIREHDDDFLESWESFAYEDTGADLTLALPLNLPSDRANKERSEILIKQTVNDLEQSKRIVVNDIDEAYRAQATLLARIDVLLRNENLARRTYEILLGLKESVYEVNPFDVAQAQDEWTAASAERVRAEINYVIAMAALDLVMGRPISELLVRYAPPGEEIAPP